MRISDWSSDVCSSDLGHVAGDFPLFAAILAQILQRTHAAHVALAPARHAMAHPVEFGDDLAVELVALGLFLLQQRVAPVLEGGKALRSEEHTSELQSLMRISYAVFCLKKKKHNIKDNRVKHN